MSNVDQLLNDMSHFDKDNRYMAACDLCALVCNYSPALLDKALQKTVCDTFLNQLEDKSTDVQANAVRCLSKLIPIISDIQVGAILTKLSINIVQNKSSVRDVFATCLLSIINDISKDRRDLLYQYVLPIIMSELFRASSDILLLRKTEREDYILVEELLTLLKSLLEMNFDYFLQNWKKELLYSYVIVLSFCLSEEENSSIKKKSTECLHRLSCTLSDEMWYLILEEVLRLIENANNITVSSLLHNSTSLKSCYTSSGSFSSASSFIQEKCIDWDWHRIFLNEQEDSWKNSIFSQEESFVLSIRFENLFLVLLSLLQNSKMHLIHQHSTLTFRMTNIIERSFYDWKLMKEPETENINSSPSFCIYQVENKLPVDNWPLEDVIKYHEYVEMIMNILVHLIKQYSNVDQLVRVIGKDSISKFLSISFSLLQWNPNYYEGVEEGDSDLSYLCNKDYYISNGLEKGDKQKGSGDSITRNSCTEVPSITSKITGERMNDIESDSTHLLLAIQHILKEKDSDGYNNNTNDKNTTIGQRDKDIHKYGTDAGMKGLLTKTIVTQKDLFMDDSYDYGDFDEASIENDSSWRVRSKALECLLEFDELFVDDKCLSYKILQKLDRRILYENDSTVKLSILNSFIRFMKSIKKRNINLQNKKDSALLQSIVENLMKIILRDNDQAIYAWQCIFAIVHLCPMAVKSSELTIIDSLYSSISNDTNNNSKNIITNYNDSMQLSIAILDQLVLSYIANNTSRSAARAQTITKDSSDLLQVAQDKNDENSEIAADYTDEDNNNEKENSIWQDDELQHKSTYDIVYLAKIMYCSLKQMFLNGKMNNDVLIKCIVLLYQVESRIDVIVKILCCIAKMITSTIKKQGMEESLEKMSIIIRNALSVILLGIVMNCSPNIDDQTCNLPNSLFTIPINEIQELSCNIDNKEEKELNESMAELHDSIVCVIFNRQIPCGNYLKLYYSFIVGLGETLNKNKNSLSDYYYSIAEKVSIDVMQTNIRQQVFPVTILRTLLEKLLMGITKNDSEIKRIFSHILHQIIINFTFLNAAAVIEDCIQHNNDIDIGLMLLLSERDRFIGLTNLKSLIVMLAQEPIIMKRLFDNINIYPHVLTMLFSSSPNITTVSSNVYGSFNIQPWKKENTWEVQHAEAQKSDKQRQKIEKQLNEKHQEKINDEKKLFEGERDILLRSYVGDMDDYHQIGMSNIKKMDKIDRINKFSQLHIIFSLPTVGEKKALALQFFEYLFITIGTIKLVSEIESCLDSYKLHIIELSKPTSIRPYPTTSSHAKIARIESYESISSVGNENEEGSEKYSNEQLFGLSLTQLEFFVHAAYINSLLHIHSLYASISRIINDNEDLGHANMTDKCEDESSRNTTSNKMIMILEQCQLNVTSLTQEYLKEKVSDMALKRETRDSDKDYQYIRQCELDTVYNVSILVNIAYFLHSPFSRLNLMNIYNNKGNNPNHQYNAYITIGDCEVMNNEFTLEKVKNVLDQLYEYAIDTANSSLQLLCHIYYGRVSLSHNTLLSPWSVNPTTSTSQKNIASTKGQNDLSIIEKGSWSTNRSKSTFANADGNKMDILVIGSNDQLCIKMKQSIDSIIIELRNHFDIVSPNKDQASQLGKRNYLKSAKRRIQKSFSSILDVLWILLYRHMTNYEPYMCVILGPKEGYERYLCNELITYTITNVVDVLLEYSLTTLNSFITESIHASLVLFFSAALQYDAPRLLSLLLPTHFINSHILLSNPIGQFYQQPPLYKLQQQQTMDQQYPIPRHEVPHSVDDYVGGTAGVKNEVSSVKRLKSSRKDAHETHLAWEKNEHMDERKGNDPREISINQLIQPLCIALRLFLEKLSANSELMSIYCSHYPFLYDTPIIRYNGVLIRSLDQENNIKSLYNKNKNYFLSLCSLLASEYTKLNDNNIIIIKTLSTLLSSLALPSMKTANHIVQLCLLPSLSSPSTPISLPVTTPYSVLSPTHVPPLVLSHTIHPLETIHSNFVSPKAQISVTAHSPTEYASYKLLRNDENGEIETIDSSDMKELLNMCKFLYEKTLSIGLGSVNIGGVLYDKDENLSLRINILSLLHHIITCVSLDKGTIKSICEIYSMSVKDLTLVKESSLRWFCEMFSQWLNQTYDFNSIISPKTINRNDNEYIDVCIVADDTMSTMTEAAYEEMSDYPIEDEGNDEMNDTSSTLTIFIELAVKYIAEWGERINIVEEKINDKLQVEANMLERKKLKEQIAPLFSIIQLIDNLIKQYTSINVKQVGPVSTFNTSGAVNKSGNNSSTLTGVQFTGFSNGIEGVNSGRANGTDSMLDTTPYSKDRRLKHYRSVSISMNSITQYLNKDPSSSSLLAYFHSNDSRPHSSTSLRHSTSIVLNQKTLYLLSNIQYPSP